MTDPLLHDLKRRVVTNPEDGEARFRLGEALFGEGHFGAAAKQLEKALALAPDHGNARRLLARAYARDNRLAVAERTLREAVQARPRDAPLRDTLAEILDAAGRPDDALLQLEEATEHDPEGIERRLILARAYDELGNVAGARRHLAEVVHRQPQHAEAVERLCALDTQQAAGVPDPTQRGREFLLGRTREALTTPALAERLEAAQLGGVLAGLRANDVQAAKRALLTAPAGALADFTRGELALAEGDAARAEKAYERGTGAGLELALAWERLAERRLARGDAAAALEAARRACALDGERPSALLAQADALSLLQRSDEAERLYADAARRDPVGPAAVHLAAHRARRHDAEAAARPIGRLQALYWNPRGGGLSLLEAVTLPGRGEMQVTGNVGTVGQEAAQLAFSCLKARTAELGLTGRLEGRDLHFHYGDLELSKDGPSAGLPLLLAGVSAYAQRPLRPALAATGEITLTGAVKPVGGIHEKLVAAALAGVRRVLLPRRNLFDARDLPAEVTRRLEIVHVDSILEALPHAFLEAR